MKKIKVGVVGCGGICRATYMDNMVYKFNIIEVVGCCDLIDSRAQYIAEKYGIKKMSLDEMLKNPEIEIIVNLTYLESHAEVTAQALRRGKHVYCEKMMAVDFAQATELVGDPNCFADTISVVRRGAKPENENVAAGQLPQSSTKVQTSGDDMQQLGEDCPSQKAELPLLHGFYSSSRGVGLADMCYAIANGRKPRCSCEIGYHAIEIIHGIQQSCKTGKIYEMTTRCERPQPVPASAYSETAQETTLDN